ncbi:Uncharacterised protein [Citrobacter amalonaticus]|nr:Uncharacterised protein [Citrobacter amalonaticus]
MRNLDAMGYNAVSTDPLYKHIPFTPHPPRRRELRPVLRQPEQLLGWIWGTRSIIITAAYRRWQAEAGDIDYYLFTGKRVLDVTKAFVRLTGKNAVWAEVESGLQRFHDALYRRAGRAKPTHELYPTV